FDGDASPAAMVTMDCARAHRIRLTGLNLASNLRFRSGRFTPHKDLDVTGRGARQGTVAYGEGATGSEGSRGPSSRSGVIRHRTASRNFRVSGNRVCSKICVGVPSSKITPSLKKHILLATSRANPIS